ESTDLVIVHKADGDNFRHAKRTVREYKRILHQLQPATPDWEATALPVSSIEHTGHEKIWEQIIAFQKEMRESGYWNIRRRQQLQAWFHDMLHEAVIEQFFKEEGKKEQVQELEHAILQGNLPVRKAVEDLLQKGDFPKM